MTLRVIGSGSAGNCTIVSSGNTHLMVDAGLPAASSFRQMLAAGIAPESITAILITHDHGDHIGGLESINRALRVPVHFGIREELIGDINVRPFPVPHDAHAPVGYSLWDGKHRAVVATDLGMITEEVSDQLGGADILLLESNHDEDMLRACSYPRSIKQRIAGDLGHLSNEDVAAFIRGGLDDRTKFLLLGHVSHEANDERLVAETARQALADARLNISWAIARTGVLVNL